MRKELIFIFNDSEICRMHLEYTGHNKAISRRSVRIELTEAQVKQLDIQCLGINNERPIYETIESVSVSLSNHPMFGGTDANHT